MQIVLIFPNQLFEENTLISKDSKVFLIEEYLYFKQYQFHKQKLAFHRASMKFYEHYLTQKGYEVEYIDCQRPESDIRQFFDTFKASEVLSYNPVDNYLEQRLHKACKKYGITLELHDTPAFINTKEDLAPFFKPTKKKFFQTQFYKQQREYRHILIESDGRPSGGKLTFDTENRRKYPAKKIPPSVFFPEPTSFDTEAKIYVEKHFANNPGELKGTIAYPTDFESARSWLDQFLDYRFAEFGDYEDALVESEAILNHSVLSPLINSGLLTPNFVVERILDFAHKNDIAINNTEGIVRQIIGWREFIRGVYEAKGSEERTRNFWGFERKIPDSFYNATTGIPPVDNTIIKVLKSGYNHHIERLMVMGNFMLLCEFDPDEVYLWFMEMYIDAYDWVMVPNVYGMSQFADGGMMSTKPYISGSNYLMKMGNFKKGEWQATWDGLFWRFMHIHRDFFLGNPRLGMLVRTFDKMSAEKRNAHLQNAEDFLDQL
ncbi:MAG: cryptochrome/photolyase family protein [Bacteroidota bacterium]